MSNFKKGDVKFYYEIHCNKHPRFHVTYYTFAKRLLRGWSLKEAIFRPHTLAYNQYKMQNHLEDEYINHFTPRAYMNERFTQKNPKKRYSFYQAPKKSWWQKIKEYIKNLFRVD